MGRRGENIRLRNDKRWEGRCSADVNGERKIYYVYAHSYKEVREKLLCKKLELAQQREQQDHDLCEKETVITLERAAREWLATIEQKRKYSTYAKYQYLYQHYIHGKMGDFPICGLSGLAAEQFFSDELSQSTVKGIVCVINQILDYANIHYQIEVQKMKVQKSYTKQKPVKILNTTEQKILLDYLLQEMDSDKLGIYLCLFTGLRLGEICALRWTDIDLDSQVIHVKRSVQRVMVENERCKTMLLESTPKSEYSQREIPFSDHILHILKKFQNKNIYVIGGDQPMEPRTYQYSFSRMLEKAGIDTKNFHILRHTFATNCINSGADVKSVSEMLGHADVSITLNRYVHPTNDQKRELIKALTIYCGQPDGHIK